MLTSDCRLPFISASFLEQQYTRVFSKLRKAAKRLLSDERNDKIYILSA